MADREDRVQRARAPSRLGIASRERPMAGLQSFIAHLLGLADLYRLAEEARGIRDPFDLAAFALHGLQIALDVPQADVMRLPESGPLVVVANHPFGALDGLTAIATLGRRRRDLRVLANHELAELEQIRPLIIPIDPYGGREATPANAASLRTALRWVRGGGALLVFPAGEVSHFDWRSASVTDPPWSTTAARLIRLAEARAVPMHFAGSNSALFQMAGVVHPSLRTLLLPRELAKRAGTTLRLRIGEPLEPSALRSFDDDNALMAHLRLKSYLLGMTAPDLTSQGPADARTEKRLGLPRRIWKRAAQPQECPPRRPTEPLAPAVSAEDLALDIASLPDSALLLSTGAHRVYCADARRLPHVLKEIGRLRELTFRAVGEGTGRSTDIDTFDDYYEHLFIWHSGKREIVGAYRIGRVDEIRRRFGSRGLYTATLFEYREPFLTLLGPALELGRSFVRPEHQKSFAALMLLWKGIGEYIGRHPKYARLIGPVSISDDYHCVSKELLVRYLRSRSFDHFGAVLVRARHPFRHSASLRSLGSQLGLLDSVEALSALVTDLEPDRKGVPVLLRQYMKLGGRMLGFNVDADFGNSIDCLILVDLRHTDLRVLQKYLSGQSLRSFCQMHRLKAPSHAAEQSA